MVCKKLLYAGVGALALVLGATPASAHGLAGKRFFPATLAVDDPFVSDELSLPLFSHIKTPAHGDDPAVVTSTMSAEFAKRITPSFGLSLGGDLINRDPDGKPAVTGFGNLEVGLRYQFFKSDAHEALASLGLTWEVGGTGRKKAGAESFDVVKPALLFGKGLGDLPDVVPYLKPIAITGVFGGEIPTRTQTRTAKLELKPDGEVEEEIDKERHPNVFHWGMVLEYSLPYLQSFVRDIGLPAPFNRMIPVVELSFDYPLDRGRAGQATGTVNPGVIWAGRLFQLGVEAIVPVNARTGKNPGVRAVLHFFLDDIFPTSIGRPIFGR